MKKICNDSDKISVTGYGFSRNALPRDWLIVVELFLGADGGLLP